MAGRVKLWKNDRQPIPVDEARAVEIFEAISTTRGWFYVGSLRSGRVKLGELIYLSQLPATKLEARREWSKIFCFRLRREDADAA